MYAAKGGEQYLTIGYKRDSEILAYSFLDEVAVYEATSSEGCGEPIFRSEDLDSNNYVANPGFELLYDCPNRREEIRKAKNWANSLNTPDFYHICGSGTAAVPNNQLGSQRPYSGSGYGGFWVNIVQKDYAEYVSTRLKKPLEAGKTYCLSMWVSLAEVSDHAVDAMQLYVVEDGRLLQNPDFFHSQKHITLTNNTILGNREEWTQLFGTFTAKGNETTIVIGFFTTISDSSFHIWPRDPKFQSSYQDCAYYYIDEVGLFEMNSATCPCPGMEIQPDTQTVEADTSQLWGAGKRLILHNLQFGYNKSTLLPQSLPYLDSLAIFLANHPRLSIEIGGHTDDSGNEAYNLKLSESRAQAVKEHLLGFGIHPSRLSARGWGESQPLAPNDSESHKALNRRVEIYFKEEP
jgi:outer membrane protein OmpA-like peptidoglycan-associated protein